MNILVAKRLGFPAFMILFFVEVVGLNPSIRNFDSAIIVVGRLGATTQILPAKVS
jgi:hypothetical protein